MTVTNFEAQLLEKEQQYHSIFEATSDGLILNDPDTGRVVEVNPAFCAMHGYTRQELIGLDPRTFIHPTSHHLFADYMQIAQRGEYFVTQAVDVRKDGTPFDVEVHGRQFLYRGKPYLLGVVRDVTERKQAEQRMLDAERQYHSIFEATSDGLIINDPETGIVVEANPAVCAMHGYTRDEFIGQHPFQFIHPDYYATFGQFAETIRAGGRFEATAVDVRKDGSLFNVAVLGTQLMYRGKMHLLGVVRDVTEQVQAYHLLERRVEDRTREIQRLFEAEQRRADQFRVINEVGQRITSILSVDEILSETVRLIHQAFGYYHVHIGLVEGDVVVFKARAGIWRDGMECDRCVPLRLKVGQEGMCGWVAGTGEPLFVPDVSQDPRVIHVDGLRTGPALVLPIKVKGEVIGTLDTESDRLSDFDASDLTVLQALTNQVAVAIENAQLYEQARRWASSEERRREVAEGLREVLAIINSNRPLDEILRHIVSQACRLLDCDAGGLLRLDTDRQMLSFQAAQGLPDHYVAQMTIPLGEGVLGRAVAQRQPVMITDMAQVPWRETMLSGAARRALGIPVLEQFRAMMGVPLTIREDMYGGLALYYSAPREFTQDEIDLAVSFADQAALAVENARLREQAGQVAALEERQRLARELHDSVSQALYGIALGARTARTQLERDPVRAMEPLDYVLSLSDAGLAEMRALIFELRPESLETEGLVAALTKQADSVRARHGLQVETAFGPEPEISLEAKQALYRIAQEAVQNIVKHAHATRIDVRLIQDEGTLTLEIDDDGTGFDPMQPFPGHLGLLSMQERASRMGGQFHLESKPRGGTHIRVQLPLP